MHFGKNATELRLYPSGGTLYQKIPEAALSHMVLSARVSTAVTAFPFAMNSHPERSYLETAQMSGQVILGQAHDQGLRGWRSCEESQTELKRLSTCLASSWHNRHVTEDSLKSPTTASGMNPAWEIWQSQ